MLTCCGPVGWLQQPEADTDAIVGTQPASPLMKTRPFSLSGSVSLHDLLSVCLLAQGNYEFGVSRVIKSLEPYSAKLSTDTWFYAKRCLLSLVDGLAKHMIPFKAEAWDEVLGFLEEAEAVGHSIPASFAEAGAGGGAAALAGGGPRGSEGATVASEARLLRALLLKMRQMH